MTCKLGDILIEMICCCQGTTMAVVFSFFISGIDLVLAGGEFNGLT